MIEAVDGSLQRLGTDYLDVLLLHWPERYVPMHGAPEYQHALERPEAVPIIEQLRVVDELMRAGKVRAFGLSNETPYGVATFASAAAVLGLPRPCMLQNAHSLLVRNDLESGLIEACSSVNADVAIVPYSPLAGGALSGKYLDARLVDPEIRMHKYVGYMHRYIAPPAVEATRQYLSMADEVSMPLAPLALAWVYKRPYVTSTVIGATNLRQLEENVQALNIPMSDELEELINRIHRQQRDPTKGVFEIVDPYTEYVDPAKLPWGGRDQDVDPELDILINQRLSKF